MKFTKKTLEGLYIIELEPMRDERGWFTRLFCEEEFRAAGLDFPVKQMNRSFNNAKGTIRGMHFQTAPKEEGKIVQCIRGKMFDVAVDLREGSPTYGQWEGVELTEDSMTLFYIPKGFAHGFQTLTDNVEVQYWMSEMYSPEHGSGVRFNDPKLAIDWPLDNPFVGEKDQQWELL